MQIYCRHGFSCAEVMSLLLELVIVEFGFFESLESV